MPKKQGIVSNAELGRILGVTHTQISRLRSGSRHPSPALMIRIENLTGWPLDEQVRLVGNDTVQDGTGPVRGDYAAALDKVLQHWDPDAPTPQPPQDRPFHRRMEATKLEFSSPEE